MTHISRQSEDIHLIDQKSAFCRCSQIRCSSCRNNTKSFYLLLSARASYLDGLRLLTQISSKYVGYVGYNRITDHLLLL